MVNICETYPYRQQGLSCGSRNPSVTAQPDLLMEHGDFRALMLQAAEEEEGVMRMGKRALLEHRGTQLLWWHWAAPTALPNSPTWPGSARASAGHGCPRGPERQEKDRGLAEEGGCSLGKLYSRMDTAASGDQVTFAVPCAIRPRDTLGD